MKKTKKEPNSALFDQIEQLVRERDSVQVVKLIPKFLKTSQRNSLNKNASKLQAADWLRRLGKFRQAYLLVAPKSWNFRKAKEDAALASQFLRSAFYLNLLGANQYALQIVKELSLTQTDELRIAGNIFVSMYEYALAYEAFSKAEASDPDPGSYQARIHRIGMADTLVGLEKFNEALKLIASISTSAEERLLQGILHQARGEYLAMQKQFAPALESLEAALPYFSENDNSLDYGFLLKWCAYTKGMLGKRSEAFELFKRANQILKAPDRRAEVWVDSFTKMDELGLLDSDSRVSLYLYPGINKPQKSLSLYSQVSKLVLFKDRDEWRDAKGKHHLGLSLELKALALIAQSGTFGVSLERLKPLLWPEDLASFAQLDNRLFQLFKRIKATLKIDILVLEGNAFLAPKHLMEVSVEQLGFQGRPTFYETKSEFSSAEFMKYYDLKKTRASAVLNDELKAGRIKRIQKGKTTLYQVCD